MKLLLGFVWMSAGLKALGVSAEALVYINDATSTKQKEGPPSLSPKTLRLLLAQRLGLSQYHSLQDADESTIDTLNAFGGRRQQIFIDDERAQGAEKLLLIVEGVANPEGRSRYWKRFDNLPLLMVFCRSV